MSLLTDFFEIKDKTDTEILAQIKNVDGTGSGLDSDTLDGQHGSFYLPAGNYTAADVLAKLLTVDGPSSGLNADLLDGLDSSDFLKVVDYTAADVLAKIKTVDGSGSGLDADMLDGNSSAHFLAASAYTAADVFAKVLTQDGAGSGLDADRLDGQQASYFLPASSYTAADVLAKIKTVDGAGSGLDADTLDGYNSTYYKQLNAGSTTQDPNIAVDPYILSNHANCPNSSVYWHISTQFYSSISSTSNRAQTAIQYNNSAAHMYVRSCYSNVWTPWYKIWTDHNDGAGSGLDADLLDGISSASFVRSDADDIKTAGYLRFNDNIQLQLGTGADAELFCDGAHLYMDLNSGIGNFYIRDGSTTRFTFDDAGAFTATGNITAYSDARVKDDIKPISDALNKVAQLNGYTFERTDMSVPRQTGVIAQEVLEVLPEAVQEDETGKLSVAYGNMVGLLIESIKELNTRVKELEAN